MPNTHVHECIAHKAVAVGWVVCETLAQVGVGEVVSRWILNGVNHEQRLPQHV